MPQLDLIKATASGSISTNTSMMNEVVWGFVPISFRPTEMKQILLATVQVKTATTKNKATLHLATESQMEGRTSRTFSLCILAVCLTVYSTLAFAMIGSRTEHRRLRSICSSAAPRSSKKAAGFSENYDAANEPARLEDTFRGVGGGGGYAHAQRK